MVPRNPAQLLVCTIIGMMAASLAWAQDDTRPSDTNTNTITNTNTNATNRGGLPPRPERLDDQADPSQSWSASIRRGLHQDVDSKLNNEAHLLASQFRVQLQMEFSLALMKNTATQPAIAAAFERGSAVYAAEGRDRQNDASRAFAEATDLVNDHSGQAVWSHTERAALRIKVEQVENLAVLRAMVDSLTLASNASLSRSESSL
jgi:hypothetical protein